MHLQSELQTKSACSGPNTRVPLMHREGSLSEEGLDLWLGVSQTNDPPTVVIAASSWGCISATPGTTTLHSLPPPGKNIRGGGGRADDEMTITKCRPTKVQCSHSPGSLLSETQDEALDVGHCCNPKNNVNSVLRALFDAFSQNAFHFSLILSHLMKWRTGCC